MQYEVEILYGYSVTYVFLSKARWVAALYFIVIFAVQGCVFSTSSPPESGETRRTEGNCAAGSCVEVRVLPPTIPTGLAPKAAEAIQAALTRELYEGGPEDGKTDAEQFAQSVIDEYRRVPAAQRGGIWKIVRKAEQLFANAAVATWRIEKSDTFGAPHPLESVRLLSINLTDGSRIRWQEIIQPDKEKLLLDLLSFEIRGARKIPVGQGFTDAGLAIPERDQLLMAVGTIGVAADGIRVCYDPYDIGAHSLGATRFTISPLALRAVLRHDLSVIRHLVQ
jgi:hypothetical protein